MSNVLAIARFYREFRKRRPILYMFLKEHKALKKFSINCKFNAKSCNTIGGAFLWCNTKGAGWNCKPASLYKRG